MVKTKIYVVGWRNKIKSITLDKFLDKINNQIYTQKVFRSKKNAEIYCKERRKNES